LSVPAADEKIIQSALARRAIHVLVERRRLQQKGKDMSDIPVFFLHGLAYAGLLFLVSAGLTLVFGMMNVLNFAHAAMYMLGAYFS
jgi:ABC-type branched-subunit amino acid transport system permease subunit